MEKTNSANILGPEMMIIIMYMHVKCIYMVSIRLSIKGQLIGLGGLDKPTKHFFYVQNNQSVLTLNVVFYLSGDGIIFGYLLLYSIHFQIRT